jgi:hypothetical protein
VTAKPPPVTPSAQSIADALDGSAPLTRLREALRDSNARFDAKLRQLKPRLEDLLKEAGWTITTVRIKVSNESSDGR